MVIDMAAVRVRAEMLGKLITFFKEHAALKEYYFKRVNGEPCYCVVGAILKIAGLSDNQISVLNVVGYVDPNDAAKDIETVLASPNEASVLAKVTLTAHGFDTELLMRLQQTNDYSNTERFLEVLEEQRITALHELDEAIDNRQLTYLLYKFWIAEAGKQEIIEDLMINHDLPLESAQVWFKQIEDCDIDDYQSKHADLWAEILEG
jgi:hypothetical protein